MNTIAEAFAYIFSEDEWFNKVLVGGLYLVVYPLIIGAVMVMGFQIELTRRISRGEKGMPKWRNVKNLFSLGLRVFPVSLWYAAIVVLLLFLLGFPLVSVPSAIMLALFHFLVNPVIIRCFAETNSAVTCMNPLTVLRFIGNHAAEYLRLVTITTGLILIALCFGWMWIVVGWTLLIFMMLIVQTASFAKL